MKKLILLFLGSAIGISTMAQGQASKAQAHKGDNVAQDVQQSGTGTATYTKKTRQTTEAFPSTFGTKKIVGRTTYDLQTNGSTQRRVVQSGNTISCGWTYSAEQNATATSSFADRGTGYAHYNGTSWSAQPTARIENIRVGFGGFANGGGTKEMYLSHDGATNNQVLMTKSAGSWTQSTLTLNNAYAAIWPHSASSGNWLYVIASSSDSNYRTNGIRNGYYFSRSNDGGATWIDNMIPMPQIDSVGHFRGGGNSYAISANGPHVVATFGDIGTDLTLLKSSDYGATWTKTVVWNWPIDNYNFAGSDPTDVPGVGLAVDTIWTNDGSHSVTVDASGKAHVAFPMSRVYKPGGSTGYNFFYTTWLAYWNSDMASVADSVQLLDNILMLENNVLLHDCDADGQFGIGDNYAAAAPTNDAIYNTIGTITMPQITLTSGATPKVLITYTAIMDSDTTYDDFSKPYHNGSTATTGQNYRDVFVLGSNNGGSDWTYPVNISRTLHFEETYPSVAEFVSGNSLAVLYQGDIEPGTILQNDDLYDPNFQNMMICQVVNIDSIFTLGATADAICGQFEVPLSTATFTKENGLIKAYPNPASDVLTISIDLVKSSKEVNYQIMDITGKVIYSATSSNVKTEMKPINVAAFANGTYILRITTDAGVHTEKFSKQ